MSRVNADTQSRICVYLFIYLLQTAFDFLLTENKRALRLVLLTGTSLGLKRQIIQVIRLLICLDTSYLCLCFGS